MVQSSGSRGGPYPKHDEGRVVRSDHAPPLYFYATTPAGTPRAVVGVLPGYGEYGQRYAHVMDAWAEQGIASVAIDLRGHGRAEGRRGFCHRFEEYLNDAAELRRLLGERAPGAPALLFGHSFGALVASSYVLRDPWSWRGLALSSPYFINAVRVSPAARAAGKLASRIWPTLMFPTGLQGADVTRDLVRARAYDHDRYVFQGANARWFSEVQKAQQAALADAPQLKVPLLVLAAGSKDRLADWTGAKAFYEAAGTPDKTFEVREGAFHEILNDPDWRVPADAFASWIIAHASHAAATRA
jgi:alpha-beta hydrolase superfamily lysophospholipase